MQLKGLADQVKRHQDRSPPPEQRQRQRKRGTPRSLRRPSEEGIEIAKAAVEEFGKRLKK
jgi:hypothetical protein